MEEQATWRGHSFTLLVFAGIVFLCSIFFVLGMLVGRSQGQKFATQAAADAVTKAARPVETRGETKDDKPELTFYDSVQQTQPPAPALEAPEPPAKEEPPVAAPAAPSPAFAPAGPIVNFQIGAVRKSTDAEKLLEDVKAKGFKGFILMPTPGEANPFYRVQVGPYSDVVQAEIDKQKLVSSGYQPIKK